MSLTFNSLFQQALVLMGVYDPGETPPTSESDAGLLVANNLIENLSLERLNIPVIVHPTAANLATGTASYTFGSGGTFGTRYVKITDAGILVPNPAGTGNLRFPLRLIEEHEYFGLIDKDNATASVPKLLYYDKQFPTATGYLYPIPVFSSVQLKLDIEAWQVLVSFTDKTTGVVFPYGWDRMLVHLLAKELIGQYSVNPQTVATVLENANGALAAVRAYNAAAPDQPPPGGTLNALPPALPPAA